MSELAENYAQNIKTPIVIQLTESSIDARHVCQLLYKACAQLRLPVQTDFTMPDGVGVVTLQCGYSDTLESLRLKLETIALVRKEIKAAQSQLAGR